MTTIRPGLPPMPQTPAQAGAAQRAAEVRARFFQQMQAAAPVKSAEPVQPAAQPMAMAPFATPHAGAAASAPDAAQPTYRRPGSLLNILV